MFHHVCSAVFLPLKNIYQTFEKYAVLSVTGSVTEWKNKSYYFNDSEVY